MLIVFRVIRTFFAFLIKTKHLYLILISLTQRCYFCVLMPPAKTILSDNAAILKLHDWFLMWSAGRPLRVLNMIEDRETVVNRWYSVRLVQYDPQGSPPPPTSLSCIYSNLLLLRPHRLFPTGKSSKHH